MKDKKKFNMFFILRRARAKRWVNKCRSPLMGVITDMVLFAGLNYGMYQLLRLALIEVATVMSIELYPGYHPDVIKGAVRLALRDFGNSDFRTWHIILFIMMGVCAVNWLIGTLFVLPKYFKDRESSTFGNARFSSIKEVLKAGLFGDGIVFGTLKNNLITKPPKVEGHTLVCGGTGSGKSQCCVIPTLFMWKGSALVMDIKGELSELSAEWREQQGKVYIFNPEDMTNCACYDPIAICNTLDNAQDLARTIVPLPKAGDPFWAKAAQSILGAYVFEGAVKGYKLSEIAEHICVTPSKELVEHCRTSDIREMRVLASVTYDIPEKTLGGILAELKSQLSTIATDDNIRNATKRSDWSADTLEEGATIYLRVSEHMLAQYKDLWTIIISQVLKHLSKRDEFKQPPVLVALDELPRLSKINDLINALATLRSKNVHVLGVVQSMAQLDSIYGKDERKVIADNCMYKFVLSATDPETQKYFSDLTGQKTVMSYGISQSMKNDNLSRNETGVPLVRPEEWAMLDNPVLLTPKLQPIQISLAPFYSSQKLYLKR